jgi:hypothetical protein
MFCNKRVHETDDGAWNSFAALTTNLVFELFAKVKRVLNVTLNDTILSF